MGPNELLLPVALLLMLTPLVAQANARLAHRGRTDRADYEDADMVEEDDLSRVTIFCSQGVETPSSPVRSVVRGLK
jgi:hypothetical protein